MKPRFIFPQTAREMAALLLYQKLEEKDHHSALDWGDRLLHYQSMDSRAYQQGLAYYYGCLEELLLVDELLQRQLLSAKSRHSLDKLDPWLRCVLRLSLWQLQFLPHLPTAAICDEGVKLVKLYGHEGLVRFANALLRRLAAQRGKEVVLRKSQKCLALGLRPEIYGYYKKSFGSAADAVLSAQKQSLPLCLRNQQSRQPLKALAEELQAEGVEVSSSPLAPQGLRAKLAGQSLSFLPAFREGRFFVQGEAAQLVSDILCNLQRQEALTSVWDCCSAPGGKLTALLDALLAEAGEKAGRTEVSDGLSAYSAVDAQLSSRPQTSGSPDDHPKKKLKLYATDKQLSRLQKLRENLERLQLPLQSPFYELEIFPLDLLPDEEAQASEQAWPKVDLLYADLPCSGLGMLARKPDIRLFLRHEDIKALEQLQAEMLKGLAASVLPAGYLLYSTCTLNAGENQGQIQHFLSDPAGADFEQVSLRPYLPESLWTALTKEEQEEAELGHLLFRPDHLGTEGFFLALLRRKS